MSTLDQSRLKGRWAQDMNWVNGKQVPGKSYFLEVFCVGKWRSMGVRCRIRRFLKPEELKVVQRSIYLNTGGDRNNGLKVTAVYFTDEEKQKWQKKDW